MRLRDLHSRRLFLYGLATVLSVFTGVMIPVTNTYLRVAFPLPAQTMVLLSAIGFFLIPGLVERSYARWRRKIDDNIPRMLSEVSGQVRSGFTLTRALELAAESEYGPLTEELRTIKVQLSWGLTFEEVMTNQIKRLDSQLAKRTFLVLKQADKSGGKIEELLEAIQRHATELHQIDRERRSALRPYTTTTYIAVAIFLGIMVVLIDSFFTPIFAAQQKAGAQAAGVFAGIGGLSLPAIKQAFLQIALIEAVFGGLGAGKLGEASFAAGIKHVIALVIISIVVFTVLVG